MAWQNHPVRGSNLVDVPAATPFPIGGGNRTLNVDGDGLKYRDDFNLNLRDSRAECQWAFQQLAALGTTATAGLALRLQTADLGTCYFCTLTLTNFSGGTHGLSIYYYDGNTDIATLLDTSVQITGSPFYTLPIDTLFGLTFRAEGPNLAAAVHENDPTGREIVKCSVIDTQIAVAGQPGIVGNFTTGIFISYQARFDTFRVRAVGAP